MQKIIYRIDEANETYLSNLEAECYVLNAALEASFCEKFIFEALKKEKIVLLYGENAVFCAKKYGADGVVVDFGAENLKEKMAELKKELGKDKYIGLFTRNRRHESMIVSEAEPDFIVFKVWHDGFEQLKELTDWYADFFLIQSTAWLMDDDIDIEQLKTDFVVVKAR